MQQLFGSTNTGRGVASDYRETPPHRLAMSNMVGWRRYPQLVPPRGFYRGPLPSRSTQKSDTLGKFPPKPGGSFQQFRQAMIVISRALTNLID